MKKIILIMLSLLFYGLLFSQEATINSCHGDAGTDCPLTVCESFTLDLTAGVTGGSGSVDWRERYSDDGGNTWSDWTILDQSDTLNTVFVPSGGSAQSGRIYEYWLRVTVGNDEYWTFSRVSVNSTPSNTLLSSSTEICAGENVLFYASSGNADYDFQVNGSSVQSDTLESYSSTTLNNGDTVIVIVTDTSGCDATSAGIIMTVHALPTWTSVDGNSTSECVGELVDVTFTGLTGTAPWTFNIYDNNAGDPGNLYYVVPGSYSNSDDTLQVPVPASGNSTMHMQIVDANGCKSFPTP